MVLSPVAGALTFGLYLDKNYYKHSSIHCSDSHRIGAIPSLPHSFYPFYDLVRI